MRERKVHFKMYKVGRGWTIAAIATVGVGLGALQVNVHADNVNGKVDSSITTNQVSSSAATNSQAKIAVQSSSTSISSISENSNTVASQAPNSSNSVAQTASVASKTSSVSTTSKTNSNVVTSVAASDVAKAPQAPAQNKQQVVVKQNKVMAPAKAVKANSTANSHQKKVDGFTVDTTYQLSDNQGSDEKTKNNIIVAHAAGEYLSAKQFALSEKNNWNVNDAYVQYFIGDGGKIYSIGEEGYVAWGAGEWANENAPVQIELAQTYSQSQFNEDYKVYVNFLRDRAKAWNIPLTLDDSTYRGIKTHVWITDHVWGTHVDPYGYLASHGISATQFKYDIEHGFVAKPVVPTTPATSVLTGFTKENGVFVNGTVAISMHEAPSTSSKTVAVLNPSKSVTYDAYKDVNGYVWVHYKSGDKDIFVPTHPTGTANNVWGTFKDISVTNPSKTPSDSYVQKKIGNNWYLVNQAGKYATGFQVIADQHKTVYYNLQGQMQYGQQHLNNNWYFFKPGSGAMQTGFVKLNTDQTNDGPKTVYYAANGQMQYGQQHLNNHWYFFKPGSGGMQTGFVKLTTKQTNDGPKTVYYAANGQMQYGQQHLNSHWYFFKPGSGAMQTGFVKLTTDQTNDGPKTVYYATNGQMIYGNQIINNKSYRFNTTSGAMENESNTVSKVLGVQYISQEEAGAPMGCEAASALEALHYSGHVTNYNLSQFIKTMPIAKNGNPYDGFGGTPYKVTYGIYQSIFPSALTPWVNKFASAKNISGTNIDGIISEIKAGHPVISWITLNYQPAVWDKYSWGWGVDNAHVVTVDGYNGNSLHIVDPENGVYWISKTAFERSYNYMKFAVSVY